MDKREMDRNATALVNCWKQNKLLEYSYIVSLIHKQHSVKYTTELMKEVKKRIEKSVIEEQQQPLITHEERMEIVAEWNLIGENDCRLPSNYVTDLLGKVLDSVSEPEKINCNCYVWDEVIEEHVEPNPLCRKCGGQGWYFKKDKKGGK